MAGPIYNTTKVQAAASIEAYIQAWERNQQYQSQSDTSNDAVTNQASLITGEVSFQLVKNDSIFNRNGQSIATQSISGQQQIMDANAPTIIAYFALYPSLNTIYYPDQVNTKYQISILDDNVVVTPV